ncbi:MAG: ArsR family transcriptional regulator [Deltaproteobacteria bacterium]|nr:ArsR family transcriptional regulator [Deltaproteobacteria bacterium]
MGGSTSTPVPRISVEEARQKTLSGEALFVCAYEKDSLCKDIRLDRGISLSEFLTKLPNISKEKEIIFYCS